MRMWLVLKGNENFLEINLFYKLIFHKRMRMWLILPPFSILRDHRGFFIRRKLCFGCRQSYIIWRVDKTSLVGLAIVFKISVIVHNTYCIKCSLSYLPEKSCHLLADSSINSSWSRLNWLIIRRYFALLVSSRSFIMVQKLWKRRIRASILNYKPRSL